ncbi:uncharacterized protein A4U43_C05F34170 [Asparagus officinalis]|uniref:GTD-binding domain-containing protein n=1 Tax=Asparagus officinalis TaxID=4686 RepID=A0A5P1EX42_ASPOF|nr:myosin-binding protein 7-like [Asparagus officinalis]ONK70482.1 uncharacterized protein A4U43_C05F34170 [Asparagus officinalis]
MAEDEIATLKEALSNQLLFIKRLQAELDDEREASASGADEALTMILRLQKEKAEEKMEACQYKQMAESKMSHAEESLAMLEQVICQKDIEIASLKHQVQSYMQMLVRGGVNNAEIMKLSESRWSRTSSFLERTSSCVQVRRQTSMPSIRFKQLCTEVAIKDGGGSLTPTIQWRGFGDNKNQLLEHQTQCTSEISSVKEFETVLANNQFNSAEEESSP